MQIITAKLQRTIEGIRIGFTPNTPDDQVLSKVQNFLENAKSSAFSYAPDDRTHFQYQESIASPLVEALSPDVIDMLAEVGITFEKTTGMQDHKIMATFMVDKS